MIFALLPLPKCSVSLFPTTPNHPHAAAWGRNTKVVRTPNSEEKKIKKKKKVIKKRGKNKRNAMSKD